MMPWISDQGDGTFANPVLHADYSDPDVIRVGEDFYMTASSFSHIPGLPILHSKDLVNWKLINHAIPRMDLPGYELPQHGNGVWAPAIRYHAGKYWIFYGDPDVGIFMTTADDPAGEWSPLHLVQEGKGFIDPCPFWDDDGQAYLVHAYANSRAGIKHVLRMRRMSPDGAKLLDEGDLVFDGSGNHPTTEGPKLYKRNGYYYIFAPAGGVATGWQLILRSRSIFGPFEEKIVLHQGDLSINGPHQGGWVELASGESWFLHFQDKGAYGRIVHLQPVRWVDDWPLMGVDTNGDGIGEPVLRYPKPNVGREYPAVAPFTSDSFDAPAFGLQWQWQANPEPAWSSLSDAPGRLRLYAHPMPPSAKSLYQAPQLLLQKFPAEAFEAAATIDASGLAPGDRAGLIVFGYSYALIEIQKQTGGAWSLLYAEGNEETERTVWEAPLSSSEAVLRVTVKEGAICTFSCRTEGSTFLKIPVMPFSARESRWVGAKVGLFALRPGGTVNAGGYIDTDSFRVAAVTDDE
ncbi:glycoside hydrolase 43 family protein [Paenibacillus alkaliterrae]|uniref:glycoside hydrolase family 43 protein n=1 Tax=Paenibacillus alkaliterrae TaxID=320909 RepID=UPI001F17324E|nr:glycoside hydrolase 43 family protein [Paenibacillus alkaliterrae]MCF2938195.1 glycoside hydrolase 43 family protein [Paenibacillus alkaliterrae]